MSCRIFVEMQKTIFILNFGPDFFARHLDNFTSKSCFFLLLLIYQQYNFGVSRLREKELTKEKMSYVSSELLLPLSHANILTCISWRSWAQMIGFHLKVRYYTRERSFIQMNTHIFQGSLNHISIVLIYVLQSNLDIANKFVNPFCSLYRIIHYIKCNMLSKSWKCELGFVHYIAKFTISRFEYTYIYLNFNVNNDI